MTIYKHIIWDWNGTLFNDVSLCVQLLNELLVEQKKTPLSIDEYKNVFQFPVEEYYRKAGLDFSVESFASMGRRWMNRYEQEKFTCALFDDAYDAVVKLNRAGIEQSVLSAYSYHTLEEVLTHYGIREYMQYVSGLDNIYAGSKTELGKAMIKNIESHPSEVLMIGDTTHDFEVASELKINCVLLSRGHQDRKTLEQCGCEVWDDISPLL
jgi:phosphoglycolate phosphatase